MQIRGMLCLVLFALVGSGCGDDRPRGMNDAGGPVITLDGGGSGALPGANRAGVLAADCVDFCRQMFASCSRVEFCFFDAGGSCAPEEMTASSCASGCGAAASARAALDASGCTEHYANFQGCVAAHAEVGTCDIYNEQCGIEWGVYAGCAGL